MSIDLGLDRYKDKLKVKRENDKRYIFDPIRRKWLVLQPEEMVRQLVVQYLLEEKQYNKNRINLERGLKVNTLNRRFDLLVYDSEVRPFLLVECKAPRVAFTQEALDQASWYNTQLKVKYLLLTNGRESFCCALDYEQQAYQFLETVPAFR